jgi:hypothetical protein
VKPAGLTSGEATHVRAGLQFLHRRTGTWEVLAKALGFNATSLANVAGGHKPVTPAITFAVARFASVGVDDVLAGKFPDPQACPHCGHVREKEAAE